MKYLKLFENFEDIHKICKKYKIKNYTINPDGSIDVYGHIYLQRIELTKLPIKFNHVSGDFWCYRNNLTTLEGCPKSVGSFDCSYNKLTTLEGCPKSVGSSFYCDNNKLTTLEGCPKSVGRGFDCYSNNLTTLEGCPKSVGSFFNCQFNKILSFEGAPNNVGGNFNCVGNPIINIWNLFKDYSKVELLNDLDAIRGKDILMDRLNTFLSMIGLDEVESVKGYNCIN